MSRWNYGSRPKRPNETRINERQLQTQLNKKWRRNWKRLFDPPLQLFHKIVSLISIAKMNLAKLFIPSWSHQRSHDVKITEKLFRWKTPRWISLTKILSQPQFLLTKFKNLLLCMLNNDVTTSKSIYVQIALEGNFFQHFSFVAGFDRESN